MKQLFDEFYSCIENELKNFRRSANKKLITTLSSKPWTFSWTLLNDDKEKFFCRQTKHFLSENVGENSWKFLEGCFCANVNVKWRTLFNPFTTRVEAFDILINTVSAIRVTWRCRPNNNRRLFLLSIFVLTLVYSRASCREFW